jgi:hypothetical protein
MTAAPGATVYYTTDGRDPRTPAFSSGDQRIVTLVPAGAPKRVLVPSPANGGDRLKNFLGGFEVTCYQATGIVDSLTAADAVLADAHLRISATKEQARVINYCRGATCGHFDADRPFPGAATSANGDDLVIVATGTLMIPMAGDWTFGVSGGGFRLTLSTRGKTYTGSNPDPQPTGDGLTQFNIAASGLYDLRLVFYTHKDGAELELFAAQGSFTSFSAADFRLVGDILNDRLPGQESTLWLANAFDDSSWQLGTGAIGFGPSRGDEAPFQIDVGSQMYQTTGSCYIRIPFTPASASYASLLLRVRYNDGFVAYLNGTEVARRNFAGDPQWDSVAHTANPDADAAEPTCIDITASAGLLRPGANLLAIHGLNRAIDDPDFLISVELVGGELSQGTVSPAVLTYTGTIPLTESLHLKARVFNGQWSALSEAVLAVGPVAQSLRVSELMYHPPDTGNANDSNAEFVELTNVGNQSINLSLVQFTEGIHYTFPSFDLAPGAYCLAVKDLAAFQGRYGATLPVVGQYTGSLDNGGEHVELVDAVGRVIQSFTYEDDWFKSTDGQGYSLTVQDPQMTDPNGLNDPNAWRASALVGGSPGLDDSN